jgi:putative FmdB family regulatory protein
MPFYEYECANCKFYTELMQKISDPPLKKCPSCGKSTMKKLISAPVFRLKGGGWYETDFKSDKESKRNLAGGDEPDAKARETPPPAEAKEKGADSKGGDSKGGDSKSESKPAEKSGASDSGAGGTASRSASKSSAGKPAKPAVKPAAKAPARKPAPKAKAKAKASKRRGR